MTLVKVAYLEKSIQKNWVAGNRGDRLLIVGDHSDVMIVEDTKGERYPVRTEYLTIVMEEVEDKEKSDEPSKVDTSHVVYKPPATSDYPAPKKKASRSKKVEPPNNNIQTLF